jgi:hypothetical protein
MVDAQPNKLEQQIDEMIAQLASKSASKRREAAYFLGEAAAEDAVGPLVNLYKKDKNASVRAAAAYALGMYKAVERAIKGGDEAIVISLLTRIEEKGKLGKRANTGRVLKIELALLVSLIVIFALFAFRTDIKGAFFGSSRSRAEVVADASAAFTPIKNDTRTLQTELLDVISGRALGCIAYFNNAPPYQIDPIDARTYRDVATIAEQVTAAQASLSAAKARYDAACNQGAEFGATQAQETFQLLLPALQSLDPLELQLTQAAAEQSAAAPQATAIAATAVPATAIPATVETPGVLQSDVVLQTAVPADVLAAGNPKAHLPALYSIVDQVNETRGAGALLQQYWQDVQNSGRTAGCDNVALPAVPELTVAIPEADFAASPDLRAAVDAIQSGLATLRTGWGSFRDACNTNTLGDRVATELVNVRVAMSSFSAASLKLDAVRNA